VEVRKPVGHELLSAKTVVVVQFLVLATILLSQNEGVLR